ncbi:MAG: TldD/PmbA family protein [Thiohalocapsa sp.]|jgi:predicted Zn-dependent protease|uniref:TldD/PmbA family protein n=1 Tax=Thiohalocapsa sp. TaxID=2497641 RepID=UPI0025FC535E|nr:TldD/PmbA family protein [Thiohalocapsa sp.]MCG6940462.1 TldD/PmbA family protein [Thiohalocapsa sp.]
MTTPATTATDEPRAIARRFADRAPACDYWTLRLVDQTHEGLVVRDDVPEPSSIGTGRGAMVTVVVDGGLGYAATADLSATGLAAAAGRAVEAAALHARLGLFDAHLFPRSSARIEYRSPVQQPWAQMTLADKLGLLSDACARMELGERIVERAAWLGHRRVQQLLVSSDGAEIAQTFEYVASGLAATAHIAGQTQTRTGGGADRPGQGGLERLATAALLDDAGRVAGEAIALCEAPECPSGRMDLLLLPSQMTLQVHESIGHPLELDRILGDERNYAGLSFVTPDMFGTYRYGSSLLNVTFDPTVPGELASYAADDEGTPARRVHLIRDGILERPLGGELSQRRARLSGSACARACDWDRPAIDRMANINLEPNEEGLDEMIARVERGVLMDTNRSWSIDDSRNKFQFGCQLGRLIEDGELTGLVRNPGYRGISERFWRSLDGVGGRETLEVRGVQNCGKGEPNQSVYVGHASPPCLFRDIEVFGGGL